MFWKPEPVGESVSNESCFLVAGELSQLIFWTVVFPSTSVSLTLCFFFEGVSNSFGEIIFFLIGDSGQCPMPSSSTVELTSEDVTLLFG